MHLNKVLNTKDYILLFLVYLFGILSGLYGSSFFRKEPEPQVIFLNKEQIKKELNNVFKPQLTADEIKKIEKQNAIERMTRN